MVKWAKDLWGIRKVMKSLQDTNNNLLNTDEETIEGLMRDHFVCNIEGRKLEKEEEEVANREVEAEVLNEMITKVETVLNGNQNSLATGPDGISFRFIKTMKDTILEEKVVE